MVYVHFTAHSFSPATVTWTLLSHSFVIKQQTEVYTCKELFVCFKVDTLGFQDQYKFIYDSLEEYCRGIDSRFPVSDLANKIKEKTVKDKKIKKNAYAFEYAVSCRVKTPVKA